METWFIRTRVQVPELTLKRPDMTVLTCNPNAGEVETGRSLGLDGQSDNLLGEFRASERHYLKGKKNGGWYLRNNT